MSEKKDIDLTSGELQDAANQETDELLDKNSRVKKLLCLGGGFNYFLFSPRKLGN